MKSSLCTAIKAGLVWGVLLHSPLLLAQAKVVDISSGAPVVPTPQAAAPALIGGDAAYQLQQLQQEVMELRGILEEQQYAIRRLQQSRLDDYRNLDMRIQELQQGGVAKSPSQPVVPITPSAADSSVAAKDAYREAYGYIREQDFPQAIVAFEAFIPQYPASTYAGNAYYWLGELYVLKGEMELAKQSYQTLLDKFPEHRKVPDATYKLARVLFEQNDKDGAKVLLDTVVAEYAGKASGTVKLAEDFLAKNYSN